MVYRKGYPTGRPVGFLNGVQTLEIRKRQVHKLLDTQGRFIYHGLVIEHQGRICMISCYHNSKDSPLIFMYKGLVRRLIPLGQHPVLDLALWDIDNTTHLQPIPIGTPSSTATGYYKVQDKLFKLRNLPVHIVDTTPISTYMVEDGISNHGDCGLPLVTNGLIGMHNISTKNTERIFYVPISHDILNQISDGPNLFFHFFAIDIERYIYNNTGDSKYIRSFPLLNSTKQFDSWLKYIPKFSDNPSQSDNLLVGNSPLIIEGVGDHLGKGNVIPFGKTTINFPPSQETSRVHHQTPFYGAFEIQKHPSVLSEDDPRIERTTYMGEDANGNKSIIIGQTDLYQEPEYIYNTDMHNILHVMMDQLIEYYSGVLMEEDLNPVTMEESIKGIPGVFDSMNLRSSNGIPYNSLGFPKGHDIWNEDRSRIPSYIGDYIENRAIDKYQQAANRIRTVSLVKNCLKDECRPWKKIIDPKTRLFNAYPRETIIFGRMLTSKFVAAYIKHRGKLFHSVGINRVSSEWAELANRLDKHPHKIDMDFEAFDKRAMREFIFAAVFTITQTIIRNKNTHMTESEQQEFSNRMLILTSEIVNTLVVTHNTVMMKVNGNSSGGPLTTLVNNIVHFYYLFYCWIKLTGNSNLSDFIKNCEINTYGDDGAHSISREAHKQYNFPAIQKVMKTLNQIVTPGDKSSNLTCDKTLDQITYLKCGFYRFNNRENVVFSRLEKASIEGPFNYSALRDDDILGWTDLLRKSLDEAMVWGEKYFLYFKHQIWNKILEPGFSVRYPILNRNFRKELTTSYNTVLVRHLFAYYGDESADNLENYIRIIREKQQSAFTSNDIWQINQKEALKMNNSKIIKGSPITKEEMLRSIDELKICTSHKPWAVDARYDSAIVSNDIKYHLDKISFPFNLKLEEIRNPIYTKVYIKKHKDNTWSLTSVNTHWKTTGRANCIKRISYLLSRVLDCTSQLTVTECSKKNYDSEKLATHYTATTIMQDLLKSTLPPTQAGITFGPVIDIQHTGLPPTLIEMEFSDADVRSHAFRPKYLNQFPVNNVSPSGTHVFELTASDLVNSFMQAHAYGNDRFLGNIHAWVRFIAPTTMSGSIKVGIVQSQAKLSDITIQDLEMKSTCELTTKDSNVFHFVIKPAVPAGQTLPTSLTWPLKSDETFMPSLVAIVQSPINNSYDNKELAPAIEIFTAFAEDIIFRCSTPPKALSGTFKYASFRVDLPTDLQLFTDGTYAMPNGSTMYGIYNQTYANGMDEAGANYDQNLSVEGKLVSFKYKEELKDYWNPNDASQYIYVVRLESDYEADVEYKSIYLDLKTNWNTSLTLEPRIFKARWKEDHLIPVDLYGFRNGIYYNQSNINMHIYSAQVAIPDYITKVIKPFPKFTSNSLPSNCYRLDAINYVPNVSEGFIIHRNNSIKGKLSDILDNSLQQSQETFSFDIYENVFNAKVAAGYFHGQTKQTFICASSNISFKSFPAGHYYFTNFTRVTSNIFVNSQIQTQLLDRVVESPNNIPHHAELLHAAVAGAVSSGLGGIFSSAAN
nr:MAG: nonstructural protein [Riboviria sp.]